MEQLSLTNNLHESNHSFCRKVLKQSLCRKASSRIKLSPTSGYEPEYEPKLWNEDKIRNSNNCMSYALNLREVYVFLLGPVLGMFSKKDAFKIKDKEELVNLLFEEFKVMERRIIPISFEEQCSEGMYKIALAFKSKPNFKGCTDYHFYRENPDGTWSHKMAPGGRISIDDPSGNVIYNPEKSNRDFDGEYYEFVGYFAIDALITDVQKNLVRAAFKKYVADRVERARERD